MGFRYAANLGFLWSDLPLHQAIRKAAAAGFDAVECHFPYAQDLGAARAALEETGLPMLSLNTAPGDAAAGDFGLAALPGREAEARAAIDQGVEAAEALGARMLHVMAGKSGDDPAARDVFRANLAYAAERAPTGLAILIEPINRIDIPDYHLHRLEEAAAALRDVGAPNLRILFDCYHAERTEPPAIAALDRHLGDIAHIQIASAPERAEPDGGALDYPALLRRAAELGYGGYVSAEYRPAGAPEAGLGWLAAFRQAGL